MNITCQGAILASRTWDVASRAAVDFVDMDNLRSCASLERLNGHDGAIRLRDDNSSETLRDGYYTCQNPQ